MSIKLKSLFPREKNKHHNDNKLHIISEKAPFAYVEAYKSLRTNLNFVSLNNKYKKIVITSSIASEGKSNVIVNLAFSLAQNGNRVLIIDCDLRKPMLHKYLKLKNKNFGLTTAISGDVNIDDVIINFTDMPISVLCAGAIPPNPTEILGSRKMAEIVDYLSEQFDYILFDTPPVSIVTDAAILSKLADGVILVIRQNYVTVDSAKLAIKNLKSVNANIIGAVLNDFDTKNQKKENGYSYAYDYNYESK